MPPRRPGFVSTLRRAAASKLEKGEFVFGGRQVTVVDFRRLRQPHPYSGLVPRWDLRDLLADAGKDEPTFSLRMQTKITGVLRDGDAITGVRYQGLDGSGELRADLTVGCDGAPQPCVVQRDWSPTRTRYRSTPRGFDSTARLK